MPDSDALRSRRKRQHRAGDHSLCRHDGAPAALAGLPAAPAASVADRLAVLAEQLEAAYLADPGNDRLAREYRATLLALGGPGDDDAGGEFLREFRGA